MTKSGFSRSVRFSSRRVTIYREHCTEDRGRPEKLQGTRQKGCGLAREGFVCGNRRRSNMSMLYPSINELKKKVDSPYTLCILAAKRARDLIDGKPELTECNSPRPVSKAAEDIYEDMITYKRPAIALADEAEDIGMNLEELAEQVGAEPLTAEEISQLKAEGDTDILGDAAGEDVQEDAPEEEETPEE
jgi:DNA-directed RNA polymerase subunit omega